MRANRLISLVLLLQTRGRMTASDLAERLEVSVRTVYRDLEALSGAGIPVITDRGPGGGCALLSGYRTSLTGMTPREAEALFLAGVPGAAAELGLGALLADAQLKVLAALPRPARETAAQARQRFHLDPHRWFGDPPPEQPELATLAAAVWNDRRLAVTYRRGDGSTLERAIDPIGLVLKAGVWYLVARADREVRAYRAVRLQRIEVSGESFERDEEFDLPAFWAAWADAFERSLPQYPVTVRASPGARTRLQRLGDGIQEAAGSEPGPDAQGWTRHVVVFERIEYAETALLGLGAGVEVLEPAILRERMEKTARAIAQLYERNAPEGRSARAALSVAKGV